MRRDGRTPGIVSLARARELWRQALDRAGVGAVGAEMVSALESRGRITAAPVSARRSWPHYHAAAMDGIAVRAADTAGASEARPRHLTLAADAEFINTGDPLPQGRDAVIKIEEVAVMGDQVEITAAVAPWANTRPAGEDVVASEIILPEGHAIRPVDLAALIAGGATEIAVRRRPRVAVIPTGDEVIEPHIEPAAGQIVDFDSYLLGGMLEERGCQAVRFGIVPDDMGTLTEAIGRAARECDAVAVIAGASAGERDFTARALAQVGEVVVQGVAIRPGKPVILGLVEGVPFIGVPGYPVSAVICFEQFIDPLIARLVGTPAPVEAVCAVVVARDLPSAAGSEEFVRVRLGEVEGRLVAVPLGRGAGLVTSLVRADGMIRIPALSEGLSQGEQAECIVRVGREVPAATTLIAGSHDLSLDLLDTMLRRLRPGMRLASTHVGSQAGLAALREGYCHAAGAHLLDPESGEYNVSHVRRLWPPGQISLVTVALRQQGLILAPGNPQGLRTWADLARPGLRLINRQRGAGTRLLLDYELRRAGVDPAAIEGYRREVYTHLAVAAAVRAGAADVGVGIGAAARALGLDFVPLARERYELAAPTARLEAEPMAALRAILDLGEFKQALAALGGYETAETGSVRAA